MRIETCWLGVITKSNVLSAGNASEPALMTPWTCGSDSVNGANVTDADAFGATLTDLVSIAWPSISSDTGTFVAGSPPLLATPAVTVMRSWFENVAREKFADGTARLVRPLAPTETGVSVIPSGKCTSSDPVHPDF